MCLGGAQYSIGTSQATWVSAFLQRHVVSGICVIPFELRSDAIHYRPTCQRYKYQCTGLQISPPVPNNLKLCTPSQSLPLRRSQNARALLEGQETLTFKYVNEVLPAPTNAKTLPHISLNPLTNILPQGSSEHTSLLPFVSALSFPFKLPQMDISHYRTNNLHTVDKCIFV